MHTVTFFILVGLGLFAIGFYALFTQPKLLKKILALNVVSSGIFLILISTAYRPAGQPPDPVPQALVLTGIVITVSTTAFGLMLGARLHKRRAAKEQGEARPT